MLQWVRSLDLTTHTSLSPIQRWFAPGFVIYKKGCTRLAAASDKVYQLLAHGRWFSPDAPASSLTKTGRHDIAEILLKVALKHQKSIKENRFMDSDSPFGIFHLYLWSPPLFIEVPVPRQDSERSCICVRCIDFASFYDFDIYFGIVPTVWYILFIMILLLKFQEILFSNIPCTVPDFTTGSVFHK